MKIYKFIGFIALLGWSAVSCNDWLDVRPDTEQKEEDQFSTYKGFRDALTGCYMALANEDVYGCRLTMSCTEALAGLWHMPDEPSSTSDRYQDYHLMLHEYDNDGARQAVQAIYSKLYNIIVQANLVIKHAEDNAAAFPDEATRSVILGEAYAIRAYCQLDVLRLFGEVPGGQGTKVSLPYSEVTAFDERATRYDFTGYSEKLIADLDKAEKLLKDNDPIFGYTFEELNAPSSVEIEDTYMCYRQSRLNYWAVKALQSRMYLYLGKADPKYLAMAYDAAKAVIDAKDRDGNPVMTLSGSSDRETNGYKACPNECLFYLSKYNVKDVASILIGGADVQTGVNYLYITPERLTRLFEGVPTDSDNRYAFMWNKNAKSSTSKKNVTILKYYFADDVENKSLYYQIIPMLRMSEMYLIAVETTPSLSEANALYKDYMLECGVALDKDVFDGLNDRSGELMAEYRREFFAEGQLFYTYKRNQVKDILWLETQEMTEDDYILWNCVNTEFNP